MQDYIWHQLGNKKFADQLPKIQALHRSSEKDTIPRRIGDGGWANGKTTVAPHWMDEKTAQGKGRTQLNSDETGPRERKTEENVPRVPTHPPLFL